MHRTNITAPEKGGKMKHKNLKHNFICMLVCATIITVAGTSIAKTTPQQTADPDIEWIHTYDSILNDKGTYVDQTTDGGYIFTGSTIVTPPGYTELLLLKTDANGEESWRNHFPMDQTNLYGTVVHQTTDGGYIVVGSIGGSWLWDVLVLKTNANGDLVWQKSFGKSDGPDHGASILQTTDDGYLVLADTSTYGHGGIDLWLIKLAADGTEQWNKTIGGDTFDVPKSFTKAIDGGYIIVGQTDVNEGVDDVWLVKTTETGDVSWQKTYGDPALYEGGFSIVTEPNGYTILADQLDANWTESIWVLHVDAQGSLTTDQHITADGSLHPTSITKTKDGGYFITASLYDLETYFADVYLLKLSHQGATQWVKLMDISEGSSDEANWGMQGSDGGLIAVGSTGDMLNNTYNAYLLKIKAEKGVVLDSVTGRFGVQAHLKNLGSSDATDVEVSITITGGLFHRINISSTKTVTIPAGGDTTVSCRPFLGLGSIDIVVGVNGVTSDYTGRQLFILTQVQA
jgi:hypothetical protein